MFVKNEIKRKDKIPTRKIKNGKVEKKQNNTMTKKIEALEHGADTNRE